MNRQEQLEARRQAPVTSPLEARREAHRLLRIDCGAEAARYTRSAASACLRPATEFATKAAWRRFLETLYPAWAVAIGFRLYEPDDRRPAGQLYDRVVLAPDEPPRRRWATSTIDVGFFGGQLDADGLWKIRPGDPLPESRNQYTPRTHRTPRKAQSRYRLSVVPPLQLSEEIRRG